MSVHFQGLLLLSLLFVVSFCNADQQTFEVVGVGECADCKENNFKSNEAFSGLHVTIDCKLKTGGIKRLGAAELDEQGKFKLQLPQEAIEQNSQKLKQECYAQLHSAAAVPCPAHGGLETTKITFKSLKNGKFIFSPVKTLQFSTPVCTSKFLWSHFKYPPLPKIDSWKKEFPKLPFPPVPIYKPKPKPSVVKPLPPPVPVYKPKPKPKKLSPPAYKPKPKPKPKKPISPPAPVYKPKPKPPVTKPLPPPVPLFPIPPIHKKPCPPLPKIPPKYFHRPKNGYFPPPTIPHP